MSQYLIAQTSTDIVKVTPSYVIITQKFGDKESKIPIGSIVNIAFKKAGMGLGKVEFQQTEYSVLNPGIVNRNVIRFNMYEESQILNVIRVIELYQKESYDEDEINKIIAQNELVAKEGKKKIKRNLKFFSVAMLFIVGIGGMNIYNIKNGNYNSDYSPPTSTPTYSNTRSNNDSPYTKEELEADPTAPSKDPRDYNSNGEYVPHNGPSDNPADYNMYGEYKPIENMTQEEIKAEAVEMMRKNGVGQ